MKLFPSSNHNSWAEIRATLTKVSGMTPSEITGDTVRRTMEDIYFLIHQRSGSEKFKDIPEMLLTIPNEVVNRFLNLTFPSMCHDITKVSHPVAVDGAILNRLSNGVSQTISFSPIEAYTEVSMCFLSIPLFQPDGNPAMESTCHLFFTDRPRLNSKLHCLVNYFNVIVAAKLQQLPAYLSASILDESRKIQLTRLVSTKTHGAEWWCQSETPLQSVEVRGDFAKIESAQGAIHADFANKHIGGGVLRRGCVQEEIRMMVSPESLLAVRLSDVLLPNEAVIIRNTIQFSDYSGYSSSFKCLGLSRYLLAAFQDPSFTIPRDDILCIDAIPFGPDKEKQYSLNNILRELEKCRVGLTTGCCKAFATGNWGCGVFGGDTQLKAVIQWIAASETNHPMLFFPFDDKHTNELPDLVRLASARKMGVGSIFRLLIKGLIDGRIKEAKTIGYLLESLERN